MKVKNNIVLKEKKIYGSSGKFLGTSRICTDENSIEEIFKNRKDKKKDRENMLKEYGYSDSDIEKIKKKINLKKDQL